MSTTEMAVSELMGAFLDGLRALIPAFERARLGWREDDAYDPWDQVAAALFKGFVGSAVDNGVYDPPIYCLPTYDARMASYSQYSYISDVNSSVSNAFVCFETELNAFDTCLFKSLDANGNAITTYKTKVIETKFVFVPRSTDGNLKPPMFTLAFVN